MEIINVPINSIVKNENYRVKISELSELMQSIKENGLLQPIGVKAVDATSYKIIFGNRRYNAIKKLGMKTIPAVLVDEEKDETILNLVENLQREGTTSFEIGRACNKLLKEDFTESEICVKLGVSKHFIKNCLSVFNLTPTKYKNKVVNMDNFKRSNRQGLISSSVASAINGYAVRAKLDKAEIETFYEYASKKEYSNKDIGTVITLLENGMSLESAISNKDEIRMYRTIVLLKESEFKRLTEKYGRNFTTIILQNQKFEKIEPIDFDQIKKKKIKK